MEDDGCVYDRALDLPGQRSVYIQPGDPVKESYRLSTFVKFPQESPVNPCILAKVGFYYTGYKDRVKCFSCGWFVQDWTLGDDVKSVHWSECQMMRGEECGNEVLGPKMRKPAQTAQPICQPPPSTNYQIPEHCHKSKKAQYVFLTMSVSEEKVFYPEDVHAGQWDIPRISEEIFQFRSNILKNLDIWLTDLCESFANHLFSTEDTKESLSTFQHEIKSQCKISYFEADNFCESHVLTLVKNAVYLVFHVSMADFTHILNDPDFHNIKLLTTVSFFLNYSNIRYRNLLGSEKDTRWFATKTDVVKQVIKRLAKNTSNDIEYVYLLPCALELDDFHLQKGVQKHLIKCWSDFSSVCDKIKQAYKFVSAVVQEDSVILADGRVYDRARDPPGQRSLYIPPGDPVKESYRLSTFIKFPQKSPVNPSNLAKVGFYYTGYKDRVKCFSCGLCVEHWTLGDDVKSSRWHRNDCQMMKGEECGNVPIGGIFARFVSQGVQMRDNLATESRQASGESKSNVSESHANLPVVSTVKPAGEVINQTGSRRHESAQTARPVRQPPPSTNYQREELATIPSVHHKQLVRSLDLRREADRMRSFSNWALETRTVYPSDLARSGFFYLGNLDRVQCFSCGGVLRNWNYGDNVHAEHRRHFPNCRMVQGTEGRNISIPPGDRLAPPDRPAMFREPPDPSETEQRELQSNFQCLYPVSPHMRNEDSRFETFDHRLPQSRVRATPRQIAKAGFFFLGERDRVKCWYCNGGLQNWDPDDEPWSEHAKWFPTCEFLLQRKGPDFVHRMVSLFPNLPRPVLRGPFDVLPPGSRGRGQRQPSPPPPIIDPQAEMQRVRSQVSEAMESSIVRNAVEMGFDSQVIRRLITRRFENRNEMYHSVNNLIEDLTHSPPSDHSDTDENCSDTERTPSVPTNVKRSDEIPFIEARIRELQAERKCKICLDRMADVASVSCGHLCSCTECTQALRNCPICRVKIENCTRTYML